MIRNGRRGMSKMRGGLLLCVVGVIAGCEGHWSEPHAQPGPVPLGPPGAAIVRLQREKPSFEVTYTEILWDDGHGPMRAEDRAKALTDVTPKQLLDRLKQTRRALNGSGQPFDQPVFDTRAVIVSLNPDVMIVSVGEKKPQARAGDFSDALADWDQNNGRWKVVQKALDQGFGTCAGGALYAGPLAAWSEEMYVFSTDPAVPFQRLAFENGQAIVPLPNGKLVLRRRDVDVEVSRE